MIPLSNDLQNCAGDAIIPHPPHAFFMVEAPPAIPSRTARFRTHDGLSLRQRSWVPTHSAHRASIVLVHGYAEHSGRYDALASYLCHAGLAVYAYDHRGAGESEGRRGRIDRFDLLVDDLRTFIPTLPNDDRPRFIMGHSLGGAVALDYLLSNDHAHFDGLILSSPALCIITDFPAPVEVLLRKIARYVPSLPTVPLDRRGLSRDPAVVEEALSDERNYFGRVTLGTAGEMLEAGPRLLRRASDLTLPFLVFVGTGDPIADPACSFRLYGQSPSQDKTLAIYEGLYHETFREPEKGAVMDGLRLWLEEHLRR